MVREDNWGAFYIRASEQIWAAFEQDRDLGLALLARLAELPEETFALRDAFYKSLRVKGAWSCVSYEDSDWWPIATALSQSTNALIFGWEANEYGGEQYLAKLPNETAFEFFFEYESDDIEEAWYIEQVKAKLDRWMALLPQDLLDAFPKVQEGAKEAKETLAGYSCS